MKNNQQNHSFFAKLIVSLLFILFFAAFFGSIVIAEQEDTEPLSITEQQEIVIQIGLTGYKNLFKNKCYQSLVFRIRTERWNDQYCASSYNHLDFDKIRGNG